MQGLKEASNLFLAEIENLKNYARRIVGTVSGATRSKNEVKSLRTRFYNECMASGPSRESLLSVKNDLDTKMKNIAITSQELAADLDYYENTKMKRLSDHCKLRADRIDAQFLPMRNSIVQNQMINLLGFSMAMETSSVSLEAQERVYAAYSSIRDILNPENWKKLVERCANQSQNTTNVSEMDSVPSDVFAILQPINQACRPSSSESLNCLKSSGINSYERQVRDRALNSTQ